MSECYGVCVKAHSQRSGGRGGESVGDGGDDSRQVVLHCDIRHSVGKVVASIRPVTQRACSYSKIIFKCFPRELHL